MELPLPPSQDAESTLQVDLELSRITGFSYGVKLVRGAYLQEETEKAVEKGYESPIWASKGETDHCYNHLLELLLQQVELGKLHVMVATHNEDSVRLAIKK